MTGKLGICLSPLIFVLGTAAGAFMLSQLHHDFGGMPTLGPLHSQTEKSPGNGESTLTAGHNPSPAAGPTLAEQPPVVVETIPTSGARDVTPGETELRVRFSKPMADGSWSWSTAWENSAPEFIGRPHYEADGRTCVAKTKLEPGRTYAFWLNSEKFQSFKSSGGRAAVPYLLIFQTKPK